MTTEQKLIEALDFVQWILEQHEIDTIEAQDKATELVNKIA